MAEQPVYNHNLNRDAHIAALKWELSSARSREQKAAIVAELEAIQGADTLQSRFDYETATGPQPVIPHSPTPDLQAAEERQSGRHAYDGFDGH